MPTLRYFPFSNFDDMHAPIIHEGLAYPTTEHFFQAMKSLDQTHRREVAAAFSPGVAKSIGQQCRMRDDWPDIRREVMLYALLHKFAPGTEWRKKLDLTKGFNIVEFNSWHDNIWGDCQCPRCRNTYGQNFLGQLLMQIRDATKPITVNPEIF